MLEFQRGKKMTKIAVFAVNSVAFEILKRLSFDIDLIVTVDPNKAKKLEITDYCEKLINYNSLKTYFFNKYSLKSLEDINFFQKYQGDIGLVLGWNRLIPKEIISQFSICILGLHGTPYGLPKGRGRSPVIWTLVLGERKYHFYLFKISEGVDDGPIFSEQILDINIFDDNNSFYKKLIISASYQINEIIPKIISNSIQPMEQPSGVPTYFPKRTFADGEIDWNKSTEEIYNLIRAITHPYPCAHTYNGNDIIYIIEAVPFSSKLFSDREVGEVCSVFEDKQFVLKTIDGTLLVKKYKSSSEIKIGDKFGKKIF